MHFWRVVVACLLLCYNAMGVDQTFTMTRYPGTKASNFHKLYTARSRLHCVTSCRPTDMCTTVSLKPAAASGHFLCGLASSGYIQSSSVWDSYSVLSTPEYCTELSYETVWNFTLPSFMAPTSIFTTVTTVCAANTYSMAVTEQHIYVACWSSKKIVVLNRLTGVFTNFHYTAGTAWDVAALPDEDAVLVTDPNPNLIYKVTPTTFTLFKNMTAETEWTRGIVIHNNHVKVTDHKKNLVFDLDVSTGDTLGTMQTYDEPHYICVCVSGRFVIAYSTADYITMYDCDQTPLWNASIPEPRGCQCDGLNNVILVSRDNGKIYRVSAMGDVTVLGDMTDDISYIRAMHGPLHKIYAEDNELYVLVNKGIVYKYTIVV